ncbi:c-type cytochrome [Dyella koreensis]|uniref:Cytochrome c domain-containing protein n=1 Tax=Dyella koreensis TaxID=311235 RepID=A0ABW8K1T6_9GAMM
MLQVRASDLLGSDHGGHPWFQYCKALPDSAPLPPDPRSLVTPTFDKAVAFNVGWHQCMNQQPATCGELRSQAAAGARLLNGNGANEAGWQFSSGQSWSLWSMPASQYNQLWLRWGLLWRPSNFDQLVAERYGTPLSAQRNPYPLPGENPNLTNGGSGQLPMALTQTHNADGSWSGNIGITCALCHGGQVGNAADGPGLGPLLGNNGLSDVDLLLTDWGGANNAFYLLSLNRVRGSGDITNFQMFGLLTLFDTQALPSFLNPALWLSGTSGSEDPPNWWNLGHRPAKFYDAGMSSDSTRIELSWYMPDAATPQYAQGFDWIRNHEYMANTWLLSVQSPAYPLPVDTALAEQGAVLFHTLDLWAADRHNTVLRPTGGNGSCASCHGAYAPRYVNDPAFLATPALAGMAGNVTPIDIINTDPARLNANTQAVRGQFQNSFFGYEGQAGCVDEYNAVGYLAQPLYGIWASAPYFHNGSVPTVWSVLKSSDRPLFWRRLSKPAQVGVVMGFDTDLARAYDLVKLGWKYDNLSCSAISLIPYLQCNPGDPYATPLIESLLSILFANGSLAWNILGGLQAPSFTNMDIENRKIYNTRMYSQSNTGHEFTDVLTDAERTAIIEYLKTL